MELWVGGRENANSTSTETGQYATGFGLYKSIKEGKGSLANNLFGMALFTYVGNVFDLCGSTSEK